MRVVVCYIVFFFLFVGYGFAQEHTAPLGYNPVIKEAAKKDISRFSKKTALSLPFFEDFTNYDVFPDNTKWIDHEAYVNNTMCVNPVSRGVATLDALNQYGTPYDSFYNTVQIYCDSLTTQRIDLSTYTPADSIYLSFFFQPGGNGFYPLTDDSLILFFKHDSDWVKVWSDTGSTVQPFRQVMIPVSDTAYLNDSFQFRFVNLAAFQFSGSTWNIDYIRMNTGRNLFDTAINDVAYTSNPTNILNDYTAMPYRQFLANKSGELTTQMSDSIRNNYDLPKTINYGYIARELSSGTLLGSGTGSTSIAGAGSVAQVGFPTYTTSTPIGGIDDKVVFENKFYLQSLGSADSKPNDTCVRDQVFDNYLAYDDGTAEMSYYLNLSATLPGKVAIEYHLNQPDTLRGLAIYFGRQIPLALNKPFSIIIYKSLAGVNGAYFDTVLREQDFYFANYADTINHFYFYRLDTPVVLPRGIFYACSMQPAYSGSDSLYYGLDVNRRNGNHAYYNVLNSWVSSSVQGAIMIRPVLGQYMRGSDVGSLVRNDDKWSMWPNPATDNLHIDFSSGKKVTFEIVNIQGSKVMAGNVNAEQNINIAALAPGMYFIRLSFNGVSGTSQKFVKQ